MESFRIGSININGGRDGRKRASLHEYIENKSIDVTFVQETHSDVKNENGVEKRFVYESRYEC